MPRQNTVDGVTYTEDELPFHEQFPLVPNHPEPPQPDEHEATHESV